MSLITENFLFLQALTTHADRLRELLGNDWPAFQAQLYPLLHDLIWVEDDTQALILVDDILDACFKLRGTAGKLVRSLLRQAQIEAGSLDSTTRSVKMYDPTSGQIREVDVSTTTKGGVPTATRDDVVAAGRALAQAIFPLEEVYEAAVGQPEPRYFNTLFTEPDGQSAIPPDQPLVHNRVYTLYVDINPERKGLGEDETAFPGQVLDGVWGDQETLPLTVWAASRDFDIEPQVQTLYLPPTGAAEGVRFTVRPLLTDDWGIIQVELFYQGHLLQSRRVEARIVPATGVTIPAGARPIQTARITFTTTARLHPDDLVHFPARVLTVNVARDPRDGSLDLRFLDRTGGEQKVAHYDTHLQPQALGKAIADMRQELKQTVIGRKEGQQPIEGYEWKLEGDDDLLNAWLPRLAVVGHRLYRTLLLETRGTPSEDAQGERLRAALQPGTVIQVNPVVGVVTIPWALFYERPVKYLPGKTRLCEGFADRGTDCPGCPSQGDPYVVCPYAFWGYRYAIEQLPCWVTGELPQLPTLIRKIDNGRPLCLNLNVWRDFSLWQTHRQKIEQSAQVKVLVAEEIPQMEQVWQNHSANLDLVYFYCHGGVDDFLGPYLKLSDAFVDSNFLEASHLNWPHAPLVFINGCATGDYGPESYLSLIDDFRAAGASGVVGTECLVPELFAEAYAAELFPRLFRGEWLGQAMLKVRLEFLRQKKNPLGLVYTLYAAHEVALSRPVATPPTGNS
jgi:hypothetical protein